MKSRIKTNKKPNEKPISERILGQTESLTETSKAVLERHMVRKSRRQKAAFEAFLRERYPSLQVEEGGILKSRNLIVGDVETADILFTAHYDTCAVMPIPNFITPKNIVFYLLYAVGLGAFLVILLSLAAFLLSEGLSLPFLFRPLYTFGLIAVLLLMIAGPANRVTVNDNTSGVLLLCELMERCSPEEKKKAAFVFFDNEEPGLFGSSYFRKRHGQSVQGKLLINFDCISDGDHLMLVMSRGAERRYKQALERAFLPPPDGSKTIAFEQAGKTFYPSDQMGFACGVGVGAFHQKPILGPCLGRIHTPRDRVLDAVNLSLLTDACRRLLKSEE